MARGNFEVGASWDEDSLTEMTVLSNNGNELKIRYNELADSTVKDSAGNEIEFTVIDDNTIGFATVEGETYTITPDQAVQSTYQVAAPSEKEEADPPANAAAYSCLLYTSGRSLFWNQQ